MSYVYCLGDYFANKLINIVRFQKNGSITLSFPPFSHIFRQGHVHLPPLEFKPALMLETFSISAVVMEKSVCQQNSTSALSFHDLNKRYYNTFHCNFTISCQSISQHVDMALVRLIHQFSTMIDDIKATQTDIKLSRYTAGSASPTPTFKTRKHRDFRSSDFSRSSRGSLNASMEIKICIVLI